MQTADDQVVDHRRHHFFIIDNTVYDQYAPRIGAIAFAVYAALVRYANNSVCNPSIPRIAKQLDLSDATVKKALRQLRDCGLITIRENFTTTDDGKRRNFSNTYTLSDVPVAPPATPSSDDVGYDISQGGSSADPRVDHDMIQGRLPHDPGGPANSPPLGQQMTPNKTKETRLSEEDDGACVAASREPLPFPSPSPDVDPLVIEVQRAANLYTAAMPNIVAQYAPLLMAQGDSIVTHALVWREKYPQSGSSSFINYLKREIKPLSDTSLPPPTPKKSQKFHLADDVVDVRRKTS